MIGTPRAPLAVRRAAARQAARARLAARIVRPATAAQRALDPFSGHGDELARIGGGLAGAAALHAAVVLGGLWAGGTRTDERDRTATPIEVRERQRAPEPMPEAPPPPEVVPEPTPVAPPPRVVARVERPAQRPPTTTEPPPPAEPPKQPPPRVVGLSLDSTQAGGDGPAFAVGNTTAGTTATRAAEPSAVVPGATGPIVATPPPQVVAPGPNQVATRIPTAPGKITLPKRKKPAKLVYPETLKAQGIEADVTVIVSVGADGKPASVKVAKGSGYPELDEAARVAALGEEFEPATRDGVAMTYTLSFTYRFRLEDQ